MSENNNKNFFKQIENQLNTLTSTKWAKATRITSGVIWNLLLIFIIFGITLTVFAGSVGAGYFASLVAKEPLRSKQEMRDAIFTYEERSEIYLAGNEYLGPINADLERIETKLENVSQYVIDAVLATEDEYFREHDGVVPKAIFRGLLQDMTNSDNQTGGSTLTQQLIKNQILTNEVSYERKAKEILLAMRLEKFMDKDEILEAYLNIIPYGRNVIGSNIAGIETAAEGIFNVKAKDLTLPQAAYIAGIPQAPFAYTPFQSQNRGIKSKEALKPGIDRMKFVLFRMKETGYITEDQYKRAVDYDITKDFREPMERSSERYPYLTQEIQNRTVDILAEVLAKKDGVDPDRFEFEKKIKEKYLILARRSMTVDGYRIHATIDKELYDAFNEVAKEYEDHYGFTFSELIIDEETGEEILVEDPVQVGAAAIENHTGKILAFVGGRDHKKEALNHATQAFRQNGSSMKPLLVYAPAIEWGYIGAGNPLADVKFEIVVNGKDWKPTNFLRDQELGIISAREALARSQNLATARLYERIIEKRPAQFLEKMGFSKLQPADFTSLSTSFGGMTIGTSVEENTNAMATFANGGKFIDGYMIERIEDMEGNIVFQHEVKPVDIFSPETSYIVTDMLRDVLEYGTATTLKNNLNFSLDFAAKTGTTNDARDAWLVGYNPNISLGIWFGYRNQTKSLAGPENRNYPTTNTRTNLFYASLLNKFNEIRPEIVGAGDRFQQPPGVVTRSFCGISGLLPSEACTNAGLVRSDLFYLDGYLPTETDDSIISAQYVSIKGSHYLAHATTPEEFILDGGTGVSETFIERILGTWGGDASKLFPQNSSLGSNIVSGALFEADDLAPASVNVTLTENKMTWLDSPSLDVIGYYVYSMKDGESNKVATIFDGSENVYTIKNGSYYVRAVDITGKLSDPSNIVEIEKELPDKEDPEDPPKDNEPGIPIDPPGDDDEMEDPPPGNNGNGNGGNNGNNGNGGNNGNKKP